ncbi:MAG: inorganic diphosphatase [Firmicutes bacterium]|nr:inorganic diphosphatase [Bacillota bacterium]
MARNEVLCEAVVEVPQGARNKYSYDEKTGFFRLEGVFYSPLHQPADYGFVRATTAENGSPLTCFIFVSHPTFPGCLVLARIIGALGVQDEEGEQDPILLTVAVADPRYERVEELRHLSPYTVREMECFFTACRQLEGEKIPPLHWLDRDAASTILLAAQKRWREKNRRGSRTEPPPRPIPGVPRAAERATGAQAGSKARR